MQVDFKTREVSLKLVYYGPALSGKTTNLRALHERVAETQRTRLLSLETRDDRTLFFDLLPVTVKAGGVSLRIKLYTVPGQVLHNATRRLLLQGADGVVFIADSLTSETRANAEAFVNLKQNLRELGTELRTLPLVIQFNKRDLANTRSDQELEALARRGAEPVYRAVAVKGEGVSETFLGVLGLVLAKLDADGQFARTAGVSATSMLGEVCSQLRLSNDESAARIGVKEPSL